MTYKLNSNVPMTYFMSVDTYLNEFEIQKKVFIICRKKLKILNFHFALKKTASAPIAMFVSNCDGAFVDQSRAEYILELMRFVKIDSYGKCFHNKVCFCESFISFIHFHDSFIIYISKDMPEELSNLPWYEAKFNITSK